MPVTCVEILNDGEGPPGRSVELGPVAVGGANDVHDYAARAADKLDGDSMHMGDTDEMFDGTHRVIEVRGLPGGPRRFRVRCRVERRYLAMEIRRQS